MGTITGSAFFYNDSSIQTSAVVDGDASFYNNSYMNGGTVTGVCKFYDNSYNSGGSCGSIEYHKPFYFVLEFSYVSRPVVLHKFCEQFL